MRRRRRCDCGRRDVRADLDGQGGESDQRDGRDEALCRDGAAGPQHAARNARGSAWSGSATSSSRRAPSCRCSASRSAGAARSRSRTRTVIRYFMTIPEATQLVLQAGAMANGGDVFVLDMGKPVRIADLARRMISLSGLHGAGRASIPTATSRSSYTGLRPAEKLYEELLIGDERHRHRAPDDHAGHGAFVAMAGGPAPVERTAGRDEQASTAQRRANCSCRPSSNTGRLRTSRTSCGTRKRLDDGAQDVGKVTEPRGTTRARHVRLTTPR